MRSGNPNTYRKAKSSPQTIDWPLVNVGNSEMMSNVLDAREGGFTLVQDDQNLKSHCDFWINFQAAVTMGGGYSPPGSVVGTDLLNGSFIGGASVNF